MNNKKSKVLLLRILCALFVLCLSVNCYATRTKKIVCGSVQKFVLKEDGSVWCWGYNEKGSLGIGTTNNVLVPTKIEGLNDIKDIFGIDQATIFLKNDGTLLSCGLNSYGQLGDGTKTDRLTPVKVLNLTDVEKIYGGDNHVLAQKKDGTFWAWGDNSSGQYGNGGTDSQVSPIQINGIDNIKDIKCGWLHTMALKKDGTVWTWGGNSFGELGYGNNSNSLVPKQINDFKNIKAIDTCYKSSLALKDDGTVWAWGSNTYGQLGDGTTTHRSTPVQVSGLTDVKEIACGRIHCLALKKDGTLWAWGSNGHGELGNNDAPYSTTPIKVEGLNKINSLFKQSCANNIIIDEYNDVWVWGRNKYGELGNGTTEDSCTPIKVEEFCSTHPTITVEAVDTMKIGETTDVNVIIHNANNIYAEDIKLNIDKEKFEVVDVITKSGIKIYHKSENDNNYRFILASLGEENVVKDNTLLLTFKLKAIKQGEGLVDILKTRIADNSTLEMNIPDENCGEKTIIIEGIKDVNRSGEFTLLDLGIDAYYYNKPVEETDTENFDADITLDSNIDNDDLTAIVQNIILNEDYEFNAID